MMLPNFVIIGAMKSGTTSLYQYLDDHPDICMSTLKEPSFFTKDNYQRKSVSWYESLFSGEAKVHGEASTNYSKHPDYDGVVSRMHAILPDVKLIYIVRDPIERLISQYVHNFAHGRENRPFSVTLENMHPNQYVQYSMYYYQLQQYLLLYPLEKIMVLASEDLRDPPSILQSVFDFLGVNKNYYYNEQYKTWNRSSQKKRRSILDRRIHNRLLKRVMKPFLPSFITEAKPFDQPKLDDEMRERLISH